MSALRDLVTAIVEGLVSHRFRLRSTYRVRVVSQRGDGSLDVIPDDTTIPPLTEVPIVYGLPGARAKIRAGSRAFLQFADADEAKPQIVGFELGAADEITLDATSVRVGDGDRPIARQGDSVTVLVTSASAYAINALLTVPGAAVPLSGYILDGSRTGKTR